LELFALLAPYLKLHSQYWVAKITEVKDIIVVLPYYIAGVEDNETM
jgi:hypothetical protein